MEELKFSDFCANCRRSLEELEKLLFVEKELGRCFCSEECIQEYFQPMVDAMTEDLRKRRSETDISELELSKFAHYQPLTLGDPDEVWLDITETGERHFSFIGHFHEREEKFSYVVVCLTIEGVPSFVFISFATRDEDLVDEYRRGTDLRIDGEPVVEPTIVDIVPGNIHELRELQGTTNTEEVPEEIPEVAGIDGTPALPTGSLNADLQKLYSELRQPTDISKEDFHQYENFIELTLDESDEIWSFSDDEKNEWCVFISMFTDPVSLAISRDNNNAGMPKKFAMVVVCQVLKTKSLELVFAFPTRDPGLVQHFRKGINSLNKAFGVGWTRGRAA